MPITPYADGTVEYEMDGDGPPLVLVHGVGGSPTVNFGHLAEYFRDRYTVIRPYLSGGAGATSDSGGPLSVELLARQIAACVDAVSSGPARVVGFSLGAAVTAATAALHSAAVRSAILIAGWTTSTGPRDSFYFETWRKLLDADLGLFKRFTALTGYSTAALDGFGEAGLQSFLDDDWPPPGIGRQIDLARNLDIRPLLGLITAPTLVVGLGADQMIPIDGSLRLHEAITGSELTVLDRSGHMDWFTEVEALLGILHRFLEHT